MTHHSKGTTRRQSHGIMRGCSSPCRMLLATWRLVSERAPRRAWGGDGCSNGPVVMVTDSDCSLLPFRIVRAHRTMIDGDEDEVVRKRNAQYSPWKNARINAIDRRTGKAALLMRPHRPRTTLAFYAPSELCSSLRHVLCALLCYWRRRHRRRHRWRHASRHHV
jgi:hypothetical protein